MAPAVIGAAQAGDSAAGEVMRWAGEELGWLAVSVARQIGMAQGEVEIVQSGSIFAAGELLTAPMQDVVLAHCPGARLIRLDGPPVVGALLLGMEQAGFAGYAVRERLLAGAR
jgi:predicted NAD/FAD-dependent oxidoreductase